MDKHVYVRPHTKPKRRINYKGISIIVVVVAVVGLVSTMSYGYSILRDIRDAELAIQLIEQENYGLQQELEILQANTLLLEEQAEGIKDILVRYEPIIIPDSMK